jgi:hypothetical protein
MKGPTDEREEATNGTAPLGLHTKKIEGVRLQMNA